MLLAQPIPHDRVACASQPVTHLQREPCSVRIALVGGSTNGSHGNRLCPCIARELVDPALWSLKLTVQYLDLDVW